MQRATWLLMTFIQRPCKVVERTGTSQRKEQAEYVDRPLTFALMGVIQGGLFTIWSQRAGFFN